MGKVMASGFLIAAGILEAIGISCWPCLFGAGLALGADSILDVIRESRVKHDEAKAELRKA